MATPVDKCIFCGNPDISALTREHLWPRWCHNEIVRLMRKWCGARINQRIEVGHVSASDIQEVKRGGDIHDFQVRCVCGGRRNTCNNGWMREIENAAKPILKPIMNGVAMRLSPDQQKTVAGWIALKAMVAEYDNIGHVTTQQSERDHMMATRLPPDEGWGIWIGNYERHQWLGYLGSNPFAYWPEQQRAHLLGVSTTDFNGQASFQVVKKLFVQVIRCRVPELVEKWRFDSRAANVLRKIWPPSNHSIVWPPPTMTDHDADCISSAFWRAATTAGRRTLSQKKP